MFENPVYAVTLSKNKKTRDDEEDYDNTPNCRADDDGNIYVS